MQCLRLHTPAPTPTLHNTTVGSSHLQQLQPQKSPQATRALHGHTNTHTHLDKYTHSTPVCVCVCLRGASEKFEI